jgi:hypothetical protein
MKGTCLAIYSRAVNAELPLGDVLGTFYPWCAGWEKQLRELFALYVKAKQTQNVLDYDDLLLYWAQTMSDARLADDMGGRFDHVLVDEYQDTNRLQASILLALKPGGRGLTVVGDDAQSIYSFRADQVHQVGGVLAVVDGKARIEADLFGIVAEQPRADAVKGNGPGERAAHDAGVRSKHVRAAVTRWRVSALPSTPLPVPGVGRARWQLELIRCRAGESADFEVEACDAKGRLALPSDLVHRSGAKEIGQRRAAG